MMASLRSPVLWWWMAAIWFTALFLLSSMPKLPPGPEIPFEDKIMHTTYYSLGAACFYLARRFGKSAAAGRKAMLSAVLFCMAVGAFDEFHQSFVPNRSGNDPFDWLADTAGGFLGSLFGWIFWRLAGRQEMPVTRG